MSSILPGEENARAVGAGASAAGSSIVPNANVPRPTFTSALPPPTQPAARAAKGKSEYKPDSYLQWILLFVFIAVVIFVIGPPAKIIPPQANIIASASYFCDTTTLQCVTTPTGGASFYDLPSCQNNCTTQNYYTCAQDSISNVGPQGYSNTFYYNSGGTCNIVHSDEQGSYTSPKSCVSGCTEEPYCLWCQVDKGCSSVAGAAQCGTSVQGSATTPTTYPFKPPDNGPAQQCATNCQWYSYCGPNGQCINYGFADNLQYAATQKGVTGVTPPAGTTFNLGNCSEQTLIDACAAPHFKCSPTQPTVCVTSYDINDPASCPSTCPSNQPPPPPTTTYYQCNSDYQCVTATDDTGFTTCEEALASCCTGGMDVTCNTMCCYAGEQCCSNGSNNTCVSGDVCIITGASTMTPKTLAAACQSKYGNSSNVFCEAVSPSDCTTTYPVVTCPSSCGVCIGGTCFNNVKNCTPTRPCDAATGQCAPYRLQGTGVCVPKTFISTPAPDPVTGYPISVFYCEWEKDSATDTGNCPPASTSANTYQNNPICNTNNVCFWTYNLNGIEVTTPVLCPCMNQSCEFAQANCASTGGSGGYGCTPTTCATKLAQCNGQQ